MECKAPYGNKCDQDCKYCEFSKPAASPAGSTRLDRTPKNDRALWDAINEYVQACGGDTSNATVSNKRMGAVVKVNRVVFGE